MKSEVKGKRIYKVFVRIAAVSLMGLLFLMPDSAYAKEIVNDCVISERVSIVHSGKNQNINWSIDSSGHLLLEGEGDYIVGGEVPEWCLYESEIKTATVKISGITSAYKMFGGCTKLKSVDLSGLDTDKLYDLSGIFSGCSGFTSMNLGGLDTSNITDMSGMFSGCSGLTDLDVSSLNTGNVTNMSGMFSGCSGLTNLNVSSLDTSNVTNMSGMFSGCSGLTNLNVTGLDTSNVTDMSGMFSCCSKLTSLNIKNFDTSKVNNFSQMFYFCKKLKNIDVSSFNLSSVTDGLFNLNCVFAYCDSMKKLNLTNWNLSGVDSIDSLIHECENLELVYVPKKMSKNTSFTLPRPTDGYHWFVYEDKKYGKKVVDTVVTAQYAGKLLRRAHVSVYFEPEKKGSIIQDISTFTGRDAADMTPESLGIYKVTSSSKKNRTVELIETNADFMTENYIVPSKITCGGLEYKVTSIGAKAFEGSEKKLKSVVIPSTITKIDKNAFYGCKKLKSVVIGKNVTTIGDRAFYKCTALTKIVIPSKVKTIGKEAFYGCKKLKSVTIQTKKLTSKYIGKNAFKGIYSKATIKVPGSKLKTYKKILKSKGITSKTAVKK